MPVQNLKYCEYFDVDEKYFPCIDESAINSGAAWDTTYPHQTFVDLLTLTEKMLSGNTNRSIWIHGAYGTGKSQCAYTLKKLLEVPENEVRAYWDKFEPLKKNPVLLEKLIGHKARGIVTAYRLPPEALPHHNSFSLRCRKASRRPWIRTRSHTRVKTP